VIDRGDLENDPIGFESRRPSQLIRKKEPLPTSVERNFKANLTGACEACLSVDGWKGGAELDGPGCRQLCSFHVPAE
jgi:hypothetical protein